MQESAITPVQIAHVVQVLEYIALSSDFTFLDLKEEFARSSGVGTVNKVMLL